MKFSTLHDIFLSTAGGLKKKTDDTTAKFRARAYERAAKVIKTAGDKTVNEKNIKELPLTDHMKKKALYHAKNTKSNEEKKDKKSQYLLKELTDIMGIGQERAEALIDKGLTKVSQLRMKKYTKDLPKETAAWIRYKPAKVIPHEDIKRLKPFVERLKTSKRQIMIVGSFRRGKSKSHDIDVMIVDNRPNALNLFIKALSNVMNIVPYSEGPDKQSVLLNVSKILQKKTPTMYKLDAFRVDVENKIPMLLYSTGSKEFNIRMRAKAKRSGYLLNQKGLFNRESGKKINGLKTEKDYFAKLSMDYIEPDDR